MAGDYDVAPSVSHALLTIAIVVAILRILLFLLLLLLLQLLLLPPPPLPLLLPPLSTYSDYATSYSASTDYRYY